MDFARTARIMDDRRESSQMGASGPARKDAMEGLMWDRIRYVYFDYTYVKEKRGGVASLATFIQCGRVWSPKTSLLTREGIAPGLKNKVACYD